ncbi:MAG: histidine kinase [Mobilitalea sp.]
MIKKAALKIKNSIKLKIILTYILSLIVVYLVTWWVLSVFLFQPLERERERNVMYNSEKIVDDIRSVRESYDNIIYRLSNNRIIYKSLSDRCKNYEAVWEALTSIKYTLNEEISRTAYLQKLEIYQKGSDIGQDGRFVFANEYDSTKQGGTDWRNETIEGTVLLCKYQKVSFLYNDVEAYIKIAIEAKKAFAGVTELERDMSGNVYLTNENQSIIASSEAGSVGGSIAEILPEPMESYVDGEIMEHGETMIMKSSIDEKWNIWLFVPSSQLTTKVNQSKAIAGLILMSYGIFSGIALSVLLNQVFGRLKQLGEKMEQIQGDISYIAVPGKNDEVTVLENKYNSMLKKLDNVIDEMSEVKSQKQKFEFKSLESQINPHFLYNTLGVMRWEALESDNLKLVDMIDDLTTFYRLSLNKGKGLLNVEQELKLVQSYVNIQQLRWDNVVDVTVNMDAEVKEVMIPKMILQPLVENIWLHGNITTDGNKRIEISARNTEDYVEFRIWDNGDGIPADVINKFNANKEYEGDSTGIGIQFIKNILRYYYGDNFIYEVTSDKQLGTLVRMELPKEMGAIV